MCVCLLVNHNDVTWLGIKVGQVLLEYANTSPGQVASHSKDPLWFPNTCCLMAQPSGHSQSQWLRSCSLRQHFRQIGLWDGSRWWRYRWREGWLPHHKQASSMSSFWFLICFESCEAFWCWIITNCFIYNLYIAGKGNRKHCVGDNGGGFFGWFVG